MGKTYTYCMSGQQTRTLASHPWGTAADPLNGGWENGTASR